MRDINPVIARSACDEAIQSCFVTLDCFAALAMTWRVCARHQPRHCEERLRRSNPVLLVTLDCFAALAMTWRVCARHQPRHCEERLRRGNPVLLCDSGLLRCARNDVGSFGATSTPSLRGGLATTKSGLAL